MIIANRVIDRQHKPFIVAEISSNHGGDLKTCFELIKAAKECGCDAVKFQAYLPEHMSLEPDMLKMYEEHKTPLAWFEQLFKYARQLKLIPFTSVFDPSVVDMLEHLYCPVYKVASFEKNHFTLLERLKETRKPLIISTGMCDYNDLTWLSFNFSAMNTLLMKCVSNYPAKPKDFNLNTIPMITEQFGFDVGLSDHSQGIGVSLSSIPLGAVMIERHFTLKRGGLPDDDVSLEPREMTNLINEVQRAHEALGTINWNVKGEHRYLRSLYAKKDIDKGEIFTDKNVGILRGTQGVTPKGYYQFIRSEAAKTIKKGEPLQWEHLK